MERPDHPLRRPDVEMHLLPDATALLFDPVTEQGLALNSAAALVWDYCDGCFSPEQIAAEMAALTPQSSEMGPETLRILDEFASLGLLLRPTDAATR